MSKKYGNNNSRKKAKRDHVVNNKTKDNVVEEDDDDQFDDNDNYNDQTVYNLAHDEEHEDEDKVTTKSTAEKTTAQIVDEIAELCESILEAPQQAFTIVETNTSTTDHHHTNNDNKKSNKRLRTSVSSKSSSVSKMDQLLLYARGSSLSAVSSSSSKTSITYDVDYIAQLAIMSLLVIYKDIIPSYRIRLPTSQEMAIKVSRDIQILWDYERTLLQHYQQYITILQHVWDTYNKKMKKNNNNSSSIETTMKQQKQSSLAVTCIVSMAELLKSTFHFNFRSTLLTAVIRQMNYKTTTMSTVSSSQNSNNTIRTACCDAIQFIFVNDHQGDVTLEATRQISKYMKERNYQSINVQMLQTLYYIPLRVHVDEIMAVKIQQSVNKKKRKKNTNASELSTIESELKEGSTTVDKVLLAQYQSDTLQVVILTYFRILKSISPTTSLISTTETENQNATTKNQQHIYALLPTCLEGLAKYAHLINIDTVIDLLGVLRDLLQQHAVSDAIPIDATLNCILTAFQTLQGPGKEMKIDMKDYIIPLYNQIPRIINYHEDASVDDVQQHHTGQQKKKKSIIELLLQCLTMAFIQRREYSNVRMAAFLKQILTVSLHSTRTDMTIPLLTFVRQLVHRYPASVLQQLFDNEQDVITQGQYKMDVLDPEHANPYATSAWECTLLQFHYNTKIQNHAMNVATCKMLQLPSEDPMKLHLIERKHVQDMYIPFVRQQKRHPLLLSNKNETNSRRVRFVTPRVKHCNVQNLMRS